jgi:glycosyltransferase involved in cell wall biosynthesis
MAVEHSRFLRAGDEGSRTHENCLGGYPNIRPKTASEGPPWGIFGMLWVSRGDESIVHWLIITLVSAVRFFRLSKLKTRYPAEISVAYRSGFRWPSRLSLGDARRESRHWHAMYCLLRPGQGARVLLGWFGSSPRAVKVPFLEKPGAVVFSTAKKSLLIVLHEDTRTGAPLVGRDLGKHFSEQYNIVFLVLDAGHDDIALEHSSTLVVSPAPDTDLGFALDFLVRRFEFEAAIVNSVASSPIISPLFARGIPILTFVHEFPDGYQHHMKIAGRLSSAMIFSTPATLESFKTAMEWSPPHAIVLPQWHQPKAYHQTNKSDSKIRVTGSGTVTYRKGVDLFVETCIAIWRQRKPGEDFEFAWIGDIHAEPNFYSSLLRRIEQENLSLKFRFSGPVDNPIGEFQTADLFILTSRLDPLPTVVMMMASLGIPFLAFRGTNGFEDLFAAQYPECFVDPLDTSAMARTALRLLRDQQLLEDLGTSLRQSFRSKFSYSELAPRFEEALALAIAERRQVSKASIDLLKKLDDADLMKSTGLTAVRAQELTQASRNHADYGEVLSGFSSSHYSVLNNLDVFGPEAATHYLRHGRPEGPWNFRNIQLRQTEPGAKGGETTENPVVHVHAHTVEGLEDIFMRLACQPFPLRIVVTITSEDSRRRIRNLANSFGLAGNVEIFLIAENKGRNFGALKNSVRQGLFDGSTLVCHVHNKQSSHILQRRVIEWRYNLFTGLLGDPNLALDAGEIISAFQDSSKLALVYPESESQSGWNSPKNLPHGLGIAKRFGIPSLPTLPDFPVGGMFWIRSSFLERLYEDNRTDFLLEVPEPLPPDGTPLHAWERIFPYIISKDGGYFAKSS